MKQLYTFLFLLLLSTFGVSQSEVFLNINHKLGTQNFDFNSTGTTAMGHDFEVERLEYYISEITVNHDGTSTLIEDLWILADGGRAVAESLGTLDFTTIESITLHIGVDEEHNHLNPASWPSTHPLAPQAPSMHWGWTAGYRFVAMEGRSNGSVWQLHGLGDSNYFETTVDVEPRVEGDVTHIDLDANYIAALNSIDVSAAPISHGETGPARICLVNFSETVFSQASTTSNIVEEEIFDFSLFPNPSADGRIAVELPQPIDAVLQIVSTSGQLIIEKELNAGKGSVFINEGGVYIVNIIAEDKAFKSQTFVVE